MESLSAATGVPETALRFLFSILLPYPVVGLYRLVAGASAPSKGKRTRPWKEDGSPTPSALSGVLVGVVTILSIVLLMISSHFRCVLVGVDLVVEYRGRIGRCEVSISLNDWILKSII